MANATLSRYDQDLDAQSPAADLVRVYLKGIGKTALLNAREEPPQKSAAVTDRLVTLQREPPLTRIFAPM